MAASPLHGEVRSGLPHSLDPPSLHRAVVGDGPTSRSSIGIVEHPATRSSNLHRFASATIAMSRPKNAEATRSARRACVGRTPWSGPNPVLRRRCPRRPPSGSRCCRRCCPASSRSRGTAITPAVGLVAEIGAPAHLPLTGAGGPEPVGTPFPHVAGRVVQPVPVGREGVDGRGTDEAVLAGVMGGEAALEHVHPVFATRGQVVAPGVAGPVEPTACGIFPFGLGGQAPAGPPAVARVHPATTRARPDGPPGRDVGGAALGPMPAGARDLSPPRRGRDRAVGGKSSGNRPPKTNDQPVRSAVVK